MSGHADAEPDHASLGDPRDHRLIRAIHDTVERLALDLRGLTVLTEAATGSFAATAAIAAVAGADRVFAIARDSVHGSAIDAAQATDRVAKGCRIDSHLTPVYHLDVETVARCDVITNLGFVRPLDARLVSWMKPTAVITAMCEAWELRPDDVHIGACRERGIVVLATNEHAPSFPVFSYCGALALRLLFDAGFEVFGTQVAVLGRDPFAPEIARALAAAGAVVRCDDRLSPDSLLATIARADVILLAVYASDELLIGDAGLVLAEEVRRVAPHATVVQFAGVVDTRSLARVGLQFWPTIPVGAHRMSRTFAHLGVRPVVELHAAGLKVGALGARARGAGLSPDDAIQDACRRSDLVQSLATL